MIQSEGDTMLIDIYNMPQSFFDEYESFCNHNCTRQILDYFGVDHSVFYINSALSLQTQRKDSSFMGFGISNHTEPVIPSYKNKITFHEYEYESAEEVWEENKKIINDGIPLIVSVDIFNLEHTPYFKKVHGAHRLILCGYSENHGVSEKYAKVIDQYKWVYKGNINLGDFLASRNSKCDRDEGLFSGVSIKNAWNDVQSKGWDASPCELLVQTIRLTLNQFYEEDKNRDTLKGVYVLRELIQLVKNQQEQNLHLPTPFLQELYSVALLIMARMRLFKRYIEISYSQFSFQEILDLLHHSEENIEKWHRLVRILLKEIFLKKESGDFKVFDKLIELYNHEEKRYDLLLKVFNKIA